MLIHDYNVAFFAIVWRYINNNTSWCCL